MTTFMAANYPVEVNVRPWLLLLGLGLGLGACASVLSPVAPVVTASECPNFTSCERCISNADCGWCGTSCMAATSAKSRDAAPATCSGAWVWQLGTCPDRADESSPAESVDAK